MSAPARYSDSQVGVAAALADARNQAPERLGSPISGDTQLLDTKQVMAALGCSRNTVADRVKTGELKPIKKSGRVYFHPEDLHQLIVRTEELNKLKRRGRPLGGASYPKPEPPPKVARPAGRHPGRLPGPPTTAGVAASQAHSKMLGEISAKATKAFDKGMSVREVVTELEITYELAGHLLESWKAYGPEWHLPSKEFLHLRQRFDWWESPPTVDGFFAAIDKYVDTEFRRIEAAKKVEMSDDEEEAVEPPTPGASE